MRIADLLLCCCAAFLLTACSRKEATAPAAPAAPSVSVASAGTTSPVAALEPKIVVQLGHQQPVVAVRWVDGARHLVSLAIDGSIVVWNVDSGAVLDRAQVPLYPEVLNLPPSYSFGRTYRVVPLRFHAFTDGPVAGTLSITYAGVAESDAERICPDAYHPGTRYCTYALDLATREVRADKGLPIPADAASSAALHWPISPDGRLRPQAKPVCVKWGRCHHGVIIFATDNSTKPRELIGNPRSDFLDVDLSPDGLRLVRLKDRDINNRARVETLDMSSGSGDRFFMLERPYHEVRWLDEKRYLLGSHGYEIKNKKGYTLGVSPTLLVDSACAARGDCTGIEGFEMIRPVDAGGLVALWSREGCSRGQGRDGVHELKCVVYTYDDFQDQIQPTTALAFLAPGAKSWQKLVLPELAGDEITAIETSPDRRQIAVATRQGDDTGAADQKRVLRLWLFDIADGAATAARRLVEIVDPAPAGKEGYFNDSGSIHALSFSSDGRRIVFTHLKQARVRSAVRPDELLVGADLYLVDTDAAAKVRTVPSFSQRAVAIGNDRVLGLEDGTLLDVESGRIITRIALQALVVRAGWIERSQLLWYATDDGAIRFYDASDGTLVLTLHALPDNRYFAVAPGGRYDTNLSADTKLVRWLVPDAPWQSLAAQTFMRDYYEPGLYRKLLDCRANNTCTTAFKPLPSIASLNRVLPEVRITDVRAGRDAAEAVVAIEVHEGVDAKAPNGKTRSGLYSPRLFRNGRLVAMTLRQVDAAGTDLAQWRKQNAVQAANGVHRLEFTVPVPTQVGDERQEFSAYAFNEDRIKGETATRSWTRPAMTPRPRRAYVLTIGIDDYDTPRFRLNYAVADAKLMASRLSDIPGYETHQLVLAAERGSDGRRKRVDRATLTRVLSLLAGNADREATLAALRKDGIDASMLQAATPDDAVIVSFSGHGWANPQGDFYLIPGDGRWPDGSETPDLSTVFATADLVAPFQVMQAGEITLVIDACHSAASVADGRFKPGPMGDSGLGQLAFDKGIRILAATQADDVALEDARLGQGLLTYALAVDGLGAGHADLDAKGGIRIDEWLTYAVQRLPSLANDTRVGRITAAGNGTRAITFNDIPANAPARRVQQPALFDFNSQPSRLVLRKGNP